MPRAVGRDAARTFSDGSRRGIGGSEIASARPRHGPTAERPRSDSESIGASPASGGRCSAVYRHRRPRYPRAWQRIERQGRQGRDLGHVGMSPRRLRRERRLVRRRCGWRFGLVSGAAAMSCVRGRLVSETTSASRRRIRRRCVGGCPACREAIPPPRRCLDGGPQFPDAWGAVIAIGAYGGRADPSAAPPRHREQSRHGAVGQEQRGPDRDRGQQDQQDDRNRVGPVGAPVGSSGVRPRNPPVGFVHRCRWRTSVAANANGRVGLCGLLRCGLRRFRAQRGPERRQVGPSPISRVLRCWLVRACRDVRAVAAAPDQPAPNVHRAPAALSDPCRLSHPVPGNGPAVSPESRPLRAGARRRPTRVRAGPIGLAVRAGRLLLASRTRDRRSASGFFPAGAASSSSCRRAMCPRPFSCPAASPVSVRAAAPFGPKNSGVAPCASRPCPSAALALRVARMASESRSASVSSVLVSSVPVSSVPVSSVPVSSSGVSSRGATGSVRDGPRGEAGSRRSRVVAGVVGPGLLCRRARSAV